MKGPRMDLPVLLIVWVLCVATDWSTGTKIALNVAAVAGLCLREYVVHLRLRRGMQDSAAVPVRSAESTAVPAGSRSFAAA